ncbi:hypothetical protein CVT24_009508 [Panaeolus cyanescens]|uniref:Uncharacterized protein n=1 Tax=Panaeolus cyanescens TaxID=181874 RepID=A0A409VAH0_9AGAR|nr:hypothetical protein CVT24_009508 [Panaeolus cyanescens]
MSVIGKTFRLDIDLCELNLVVDRILRDLVPFTHASNLIDETTIKELRKHVAAVVQAAEWNMIALEHLQHGFGAHANTSDAHRMYQETAQGLQLLFDRLVQKHGKDAVITLESTTTDKVTLTIEHINVGQLTSNLERQLNDAQELTNSVSAWLLEFNQMIQSFLQDENASLDIRVDQLPFLSVNWHEKFGDFAAVILNGKRQRNKILAKYPSLFTLTPSNILDHYEQDMLQRRPLIKLPPHKLKVPDPAPRPPPSSTPFPSTIVLKSFQRGPGHFAMTLTSIDQTTAGHSSVKLLLNAAPTVGKYNAITIRCKFDALNGSSIPPESFQLVDHDPITAKRIAEDPEAEPCGWRPKVKATFVRPDLLEWRFAQRFLPMINTSSPACLNFAVTFMHVIDLKLLFEVWIYRSEWAFWKTASRGDGQAVVIARK